MTFALRLFALALLLLLLIAASCRNQAIAANPVSGVRLPFAQFGA